MASVILAALLLLVVTLTASSVYLFLRLRELERDVDGIVNLLQEYQEDSALLQSSSQILYS